MILSDFFILWWGNFLFHSLYCKLHLDEMSATWMLQQIFLMMLSYIRVVKKYIFYLKHWKFQHLYASKLYSIEKRKSFLNWYNSYPFFIISFIVVHIIHCVIKNIPKRKNEKIPSRFEDQSIFWSNYYFFIQSFFAHINNNFLFMKLL